MYLELVQTVRGRAEAREQAGGSGEQVLVLEQVLALALEQAQGQELV
jgi:hypothetical protein